MGEHHVSDTFKQTNGPYHALPTQTDQEFLVSPKSPTCLRFNHLRKQIGQLIKKKGERVLYYFSCGTLLHTKKA